MHFIWEENTPYLRKFGHNIKNNAEGRKLSEDTTGKHVCSCESIVPRFQTSSILSHLTTPRTVLSIH